MTIVHVDKPDSVGSRVMGSYMGMSSIGISIAQLLAHKDIATQEIIYFQRKLLISCTVLGKYLQRFLDKDR